MAKKEKLYYDDSGTSFKEAFAEARAEGKKTFEWNGEKYNTKLKSDAKGPDESAAETKRLTQQAEATKEEPRKPTNRGAAAALAGAGVGMGTAALLSGMRRSEEARKERELGKASGKDVMRSPIRNIAPEEAATENMKRGGKVKKYASGGITAAVKPEPKKDTMPEWAKAERENKRRDELNKREAEGAAKEVKRNMSTFGFKNGGSASSRADGIAQRGKTRGKIV
jgi:hypothetical protein